MSPIVVDKFSDVERKLNQIEEYLLRKHETKIHQEIAWKYMADFIKEYHIYLLDEVYVTFLIKLSIKLASIFYISVKIRDSYFKKKKQKENSKKTIKLYKTIIENLVAHKYPIHYYIIIDSFDLYDLWQYESFCAEITEIFLNMFDSSIFTEYIGIIERFIFEDTADFRKINALFYMLVEISEKSSMWPVDDEDYLLKLIGLHVTLIDFKSNNLRQGVEACITKSLKGASASTLLAIIDYVLEVYSIVDLEDSYLRNLENTVKTASNMFISCESIWTTFKYDTLKIILTLISSDNKSKCIFGNETFQNMIDSKRNAHNFVSPKIFFIKMHYKLKFDKVDLSGEEFLKRYRKEFHICFLTAIYKHRDDINIINSVYTSMCLLLTAIPCEFTAAMLVCLIMHIQKNTLNNENFSGPASHRIHAMVISVMSLVCWISNAKMLYSYMEKILKLRAYNAPFLNPPFKANYTYATHYVLWNKPDFFFENFEVRYAMWKRFRLDEKFTDTQCIFDKLKMAHTLTAKKSLFYWSR